MPRLQPKETDEMPVVKEPVQEETTGLEQQQQQQVQIITESQYIQHTLITIIENQQKILSLLSSKQE